jgi:hypothetical protein
VALATIEGIDDILAHTLYKLGFRSPEELIEADPSEFAGIPGLGGAEAADRIKAAAEVAMEQLRQRRITEASRGTEPLTERERLLFVRGVGERTIDLLDVAGYKTVEDVYREPDEDRLAIRTGLGLKKARQIKQGARDFIDSEMKVIEAARAEAAERAVEEGGAADADGAAAEPAAGDAVGDGAPADVAPGAEAGGEPGALDVPRSDAPAEDAAGADERPAPSADEGGEGEGK